MLHVAIMIDECDFLVPSILSLVVLNLFWQGLKKAFVVRVYFGSLNASSHPSLLYHNGLLYGLSLYWAYWQSMCQKTRFWLELVHLLGIFEFVIFDSRLVHWGTLSCWVLWFNWVLLVLLSSWVFVGIYGLCDGVVFWFGICWYWFPIGICWWFCCGTW